MAEQITGLTNSSIAPNADIDPVKMRHRHRAVVSQATGTAILAANETIAIARGNGTLKSFRVVITGAVATGGDRTVTVDLKKSTGAGAFATVLSGTVGFTNGSALLTVTAGTLSDTTVQAGDIFQVTVAVAGAAGNQAQGLCSALEWEEVA